MVITVINCVGLYMESCAVVWHVHVSFTNLPHGQINNKRKSSPVNTPMLCIQPHSNVICHKISYFSFSHVCCSFVLHFSFDFWVSAVVKHTLATGNLWSFTYQHDLHQSYLFMTNWNSELTRLEFWPTFNMYIRIMLYISSYVLKLVSCCVRTFSFITCIMLCMYI